MLLFLLFFLVLTGTSSTGTVDNLIYAGVTSCERS